MRHFLRSSAILLLVLSFTPAAPAQEKKPAKDEKPPEKLWVKLDTPGHIGSVESVFFTPDGQRLVSVGGNEDRSVRIWDAVTGQRQRVHVLQLVSNHGAEALSPDGKTLALSYGGPPECRVNVGGNQLPMHVRPALLNLETGQIIRLEHPALYTGFDLPLHERTRYAFSGNGDGLAVARGGSVHVWRGLRGTWTDARIKDNVLAVAPWKSLRLGGVRESLLSPDGSRLLALVESWGNDKDGKVEFKGRKIELWDLNADPPALAVSIPTSAGSWRGGRFAWSPDGKRFGCFGEKDELAVYAATGKLHKTIPFATAKSLYLEMSFSGDSELAVRQLTKNFTANRQAVEVVFLNVETSAKRVVKTSVHQIPASSNAPTLLSPDGKRLANFSPAGTFIELLDLAGTAKPLVISRARSDMPPETNWDRTGSSALVYVDRKLFIAGIAFDRSQKFGFDFKALKPLSSFADTDVYRDKSSKGTKLIPDLVDRMFPRPDLSQDGKHFIHILDQSFGGDVVAVSSAYKKNEKENAWFDTRPLLKAHVSGADWVVWTEEGYYAASPGGERIMGWAVHDVPGKTATFYPADRFRKQLYRPDVIKLVLEKGSVAEALKIANARAGIEKTRDVKIENLLPPRAVLALLQQDKATVKLKVVAVAGAKDQPVTALRLLVDGRPLADGSAHEKFEGGNKNAEAEWTVTLPPGKHLLTVLARCPDASSKSNSIEVVVADPARQNAMHVLAIGVNDYEDNTLKLAFAAKDAQDIAAGFQKGSKGELFQQVNGVVLTDARATKSAILKQIAETRKQVKPSDLVVVFFAGHGVKEKDKFYLLPVEAKTNNLAGTAISGAELRKGLGEFPCQVLLMLDACHSSGGVKNFRPAVDDITRNLTDDDCGVAVMCSAMAHEKALEKDGNGLFTKAVVQALNRAEGVPFDRYSRLFYVSHLHAYVFDEVRHHSGDRQHPFLSLPWVVESFPVAQFASK